MTVTILTGDCRDVLKTLPDESVHCVVTSPPYWGLRDYGTADWEGGDEGCDHCPEVMPRKDRERNGLTGGLEYMDAKDPIYRHTCAKCGAIRIDQQLGLESTPEEYLTNMVEVFREVRRVMRDDATLWLNMGDSYAGSWGNYAPGGIRGEQRPQTESGQRWERRAYSDTTRLPPTANVHNLKPKDLCGIPWRLALALQADGWWLRSDIIWHKPNPMPESVTDRPTKAHEYVFLMTKAARYYYDADAVREELAPISKYQIELSRRGVFPPANNHVKNTYNEQGSGHFGTAGPGGAHRGAAMNPAGRNRRTVWTIATQPYSGAHFATFPPKLVEPCIKAGTSEKGVCPECGAGWERVVEKFYKPRSRKPAPNKGHLGAFQERAANMTRDGFVPNRDPSIITIGWRPTCTCDAGDPIPATCLDPFGGAGTVGLVADRLDRDAILIELNPDYAEMARRRIVDDAGMFADVKILEEVA